MELNIPGLSDVELQLALKQLTSLPKHEQIELNTMLTQLEKVKGLEKSQNTFLDFIHHVYNGYKVGAHHAKLAKIFEDIANGKKKRVIVNIAPRHGKSELISYLAPAWFLGKHPATV